MLVLEILEHSLLRLLRIAETALARNLDDAQSGCVLLIQARDNCRVLFLTTGKLLRERLLLTGQRLRLLLLDALECLRVRLAGFGQRLLVSGFRGLERSSVFFCYALSFSGTFSEGISMLRTKLDEAVVELLFGASSLVVVFLQRSFVLGLRGLE